MERKRSYFKVWQSLFLLALMFPVFGFAQTIQVNGTVLDASGESVIGASVLEKGTTNGVITDLDGKFQLEVSAKGTLQISYVGFQTQEIPVNNKKVFNITLKEDSEMLEEVIVVGYGTMKKSDMTGAISSVDTEELVKRATTNPAEALQGKIAGVNIMKSGGNAGAGVSVKIRGVKSFGDNEPLYIIDGFPGDINSVNPVDIQSMEVLKDGAAAAIYGSVAANGVVIITTKNGKKGETHIDFNTYLSFTNVAKSQEFVNAEQYKYMTKMMYENYNLDNPHTPRDIPSYVDSNTGIDTDWQDEMMRSGFAQNYMFSVRGGGETAQYSVSYNHADEKGIFLGNNFRQDNARMKMHMSKYIFDVDANLSFRYTKSKQPTFSLREMYNISPLVPVYDENEKYGFGLTATQGLPDNNNPMADHYYRDENIKSFYTNANVSLGIKITSWLNFKTSYAYRGKHYRKTLHFPDYISNAKAAHLYPYSSESTYYWEEQVIDNVLTFNKEFGNHSINAMVGSSITTNKQNSSGVGVEGFTTKYSVDPNTGNLISENVPSGFLDSSFATINGGDGGTYSGSGTLWEYHRASFFGRINYNYHNRYLVQATIRRDGSSKFGKNNRWGTFPSVALGWRISEESFFPKGTFVDNLKIRASWGRLGNESALGYYDFQAKITTFNSDQGGYVQGVGENPWPGSVAWNMARNDLKWETTDTKNFGIDYAMFGSRLTGSLNYYINQTNDLLITKKQPISVAYQNPVLNVGKIRNRGFEFEMNWADKIRDFDYSIGFNFSTTNNEVVSLADEGQTLNCTGLVYGTDYTPAYATVGKPISAFYLYRTDGIFQSMEEVNAHSKDGKLIQPKAKPGDIRFKDLNDDGVLDEADREYAGTGIPKVEANLNLSAGYKGFDLTLSFGSAWGHKLFNGNRYYYESMQSEGNMLTSTLAAWTPQNTNTDIPRAIIQDPNKNARESDRFLESGNFVRLRQAQLGYSLPVSLLKKVHIEKLRFYVSGENLFTITNYSGTDPEFSRSSPLDTGIDSYIFPFTRSFTVGAQLTF